MSKFYIDKEDPTPLYYQLKEIIVERIKNGEYKAGTQIPTEKELMSEFDISRTTVRQAIDILVNDTILEKKRGVGTFVADKPEGSVHDLAELNNYQDSLKKIGRAPKTELIEQTIVKKNNQLINVFGNEYEEYYRLERLRFTDDIPTLLVTTYVPKKLFPDLLDYNFSDVSLFDVMRKDYNQTISHAQKIFDAVTVTESDAKILGICKDCPIHLVTTTTFNGNNQPIEFSKSRDRGDMSRFKITLEYQGNESSS